MDRKSPDTEGLEIEGLRVAFGNPENPLIAVAEVSLQVQPGTVYALVGESGSGKSTIAFAAAGLLPWDQAHIHGRIRIGTHIADAARPADFATLRGRKIGFVFQEPGTALHPAIRVGSQVGEAIFEGTGAGKHKERLLDLFERVQLPPHRRLLRSFPHELSGGMRQRVGLAIALANHPPVLIADEPTTALDSTTRKAILEQIRTAARDEGRAVLLITHDFGIVANYADEVGVLLKGRLVEHGTTSDVLRQPRHEYTQRLIAAIPVWNDTRETLGEIPA